MCAMRNRVFTTLNEEKGTFLGNNMMNLRRDLPAKWKGLLITYLHDGRESLQCTDFPDHTVNIIHEDGSRFELKNAFFIEDDTEVMVFTEHVGYYLFYKDELADWYSSKRLTSESD
jgi:hypothetical protein